MKSPVQVFSDVSADRTARDAGCGCEDRSSPRAEVNDDTGRGGPGAVSVTKKASKEKKGRLIEQVEQDKKDVAAGQLKYRAIPPRRPSRQPGTGNNCTSWAVERYRGATEDPDDYEDLCEKGFTPGQCAEDIKSRG